MVKSGSVGAALGRSVAGCWAMAAPAAKVNATNACTKTVEFERRKSILGNGRDAPVVIVTLTYVNIRCLLKLNNLTADLASVPAGPVDFPAALSTLFACCEFLCGRKS